MNPQNSPFHRSFAARNQHGNATIYVLIVVALFAALAFTVSRQNDSSESALLGPERAGIIASQLIAYPYQVQQAVEMMTMTGTEASALDYNQPGQAGYDAAPHANKIYHPGGGGLNLARLSDDAIAQSSTTPPAGWYLGMFNNVEWSVSAEPDLMLVAYQISREICEQINLRLTGSTDIPDLSNTIPNVLIDNDNPPGNAVHSGLNAVALDTGVCADCEDRPSLCVGDTSGTRYGFYSMILNR